MARQVRNNWQMGEVAALAGVEPNKAQKKLDIINEGGDIAQEFPPFPESRSCNDVIWVGIFFVVLLATSGVAVGMGRNIFSPTPEPTGLMVATTTAVPTAPGTAAWVTTPLVVTGANVTSGRENDFQAKNVKPVYLILATVGGSGAAVVASLFLIFLSKHCATCMVYTSLLFSCALMIAMGISLIIFGSVGSGLPASFDPLFKILGGVMIAIGCCMATCILCCWGKFIQFTAEVVEECGTITLDNPCMLLVAIGGGILAAMWSLVVAFALDGVVAQFQDEISKSRYVAYAVFGCFFFVWIWGCMVSAAVCYTTYCGVFGKWYYSGEDGGEYQEGNVICSSLCNASTTSLGSICFGTFLVAAIRTAEFIARRMQQDAMEDGNIVLCILFCCIRCILDCIGDIVEYFNEWAYVQCAIRATTFCESAKIVFSLCTAANVWAIWATLLIDSVVNFGSFMTGFAGAVVGAGIGYIGSVETCLLGALCGFVAGMGVGWCVMSVFTAGAKTLCTCWAENPDTLMRKHNIGESNLGLSFNEKVGGGPLMY